MKQLIIFIVLIMLSTSYTQADVYIVTNKYNDEVISISNENDCVVDNDMKLEILEDIDIGSVHLAHSPVMYTYKGGSSHLTWKGYLKTKTRHLSCTKKIKRKNWYLNVYAN